MGFDLPNIDVVGFFCRGVVVWVVVVEVCASAGTVSASARAVVASKRVIMADTPNSF